MSDSMYAVGWLEQKRYDQAVKSFDKMFAHIKGDFQVNTFVSSITVVVVVPCAGGIGSELRCAAQEDWRPLNLLFFILEAHKCRHG
jgi:hypothetical protein